MDGAITDMGVWPLMLEDMDGSKTEAMVSCWELLKRLRLIWIFGILYFGDASRMQIDATTSWGSNANWLGWVR